MKHEEISLNTKKALAESLKKTMKNKPFKKITVSELIQDCNINRNTFYYHFEDIYALLKWMFEQEAIAVVKNFDILVNYEEALNFVMDYVEANNYIINCAYDSIGQDELKRFFYADFLEIICRLIGRAEEITGQTLGDDYKEFLSHFYMEAMVGMLIEWIKDNKKRTRDSVVKYISYTLQESLLGILNADIENYQ